MPEFINEHYPAMELQEADAACPSRGQLDSSERCRTCAQRIILHCSDCKIQITACLCTLEERMTEEERGGVVRQLADLQSMERLRAQGVWIPGSDA